MNDLLNLYRKTAGLFLAGLAVSIAFLPTDLLGAEPAKSAAAPPAAVPETYTVKKGRLALDISAEGTLLPIDPFDVRIKLKVHQGTVSVIRAAVHGAMVQKGDVLLECDTTQIRWALQGAENDLAAAKASLAKTESDAQVGAKSDALALRVQEDSLKHAEESVAWFEKVDGPQMLKGWDFQVQMAKDSVGDQQDELEQLKKMYKSEELTGATADIVTKRAVRRLEQAKQAMEMSEGRRDKFKSLDFGTEKKRVENAVEQARQSLATLKAAQAQSAVQRANSIKSAKVAVEQAEAKLADYKADLNEFTITSPANGLVVYTQSGESGWQGTDAPAFKPGEKLPPATVVMRVVTPGKLRVEASVNEAQSLWLDEGLKARVIPTALPQISYELPCPRPMILPKGTSPTLSFALSIPLPNADPRLAVGMKATVKIDAWKGDEVLVVPLAAVSGGRVWLKTADGKFDARPVTLGRTDGTSVEILTGLNAGDEISATAKK